MPTVYLPLGSAEAYGSVGEMVIYQGQWVRRYVVPRDPRTDAQLNIRYLFHDITKTIRAAGAFARAAWSGLFGPRWFAKLTGYCQKDFMDVWTAAGAEWEAMQQADQDSWNAAAAYGATWNEPGRIFYSVARMAVQMFDVTGWPDYQLPVPNASNSAVVSAWWTWGLENALQPGKYDDTDPMLTWDSNWHTVEEPQAFNGSYHQQSGSGVAMCSFYFCGSGVRMYYKTGAPGGTVKLRVSNEYIQTDLSNWAEAYQSSNALMGLNQGLHYCTIAWHEFGLVNLDAIEIYQ